MRLTNRQWERVKVQLPRSKSCQENPDSFWCEDRAILEGVLWILRSGAAWAKLPRRYPPHAMCYDSFQAWKRSDTLFTILKALADDLIEHNKLNLNAKHVAALFPLTQKKSTVWAPNLTIMADDVWAWHTLMVFSSPSTWQALSATKARWLRRYVRDGLCHGGDKKTVAAVTKQPSVLLHPCYNSSARKILP
jgi:transposase